MASFQYVGRNNQQEEVSGVVDADTTAQAVQQLAALGIAATDVTERAVRDDRRSGESWLDRMQAPAITGDDVILFSRQMYTLQRSNVPILRAFAGLQESTGNASFAHMLADVRASLDQGRELSVALARHPKVFSAFYLAMVRVGEVSGRLGEVFSRLFEHLEFEKDVQAQIRAALRYPLTVMVAVSVALIILNIFVIPVFAGVFAGFNAKLPFMTRFLIAFSAWTVKWWPFLLAGTVGGVWAIRAYVATSAGRYAWDRVKLQLPIIGDIVLKATLARFARSFSLASKSGIPVLQALTIVSKTVDNAYIARHIENMREGIERGDSLYRCAAQSGVFTPVVLQMIAVGEETGEIDSLLAEIAGMYERETAYAIRGLSAKIEPLLLSIMALLVLVLALGVFMPMWSLGQAALGKGG